MDEGVAYYIPLSDIEEATENFSKKIGKGSFGPVYYGRLRDGKEVAVKTMADSSSHGTKQFATEVLSWLPYFWYHLNEIKYVSFLFGATYLSC